MTGSFGGAPMTAMADVRAATPHADAPAALEADVAVVGLGPAGIAAAARAAETGRRVVVLDSSPNAGGQIWRHRARASLGGEARRWLGRLVRSGARLLHGTSVVDVVRPGADARSTILCERHTDGAAVVLRAGAIVVATGARERFLPFPGWTLPGVIGVGGAQALLKQGASFAGKRVVIAGTGPLMLPVAASLTGAGARVAMVAEQASPAAVRGFVLSLVRHPETLAQAAMYRLAFLRAPYATGTWVVEAVGTESVAHAVLTDGRATRRIACDVLCTGYGLVPNAELARLLGCDTAGGNVLVSDAQETSVRGVFAAGEVAGIGGVALAMVEGELAGAAAAGITRPDPALVRRRAALREMAAALDRAFALRAELRALPRDDTIVCRCEDVLCGALRTLRESRQAKLYTRAGMGACQGRVCGPALDFLFGWRPGAVRAPIEPARLSTLTVAGAAVPGASGAAAASTSSSG